MALCLHALPHGAQVQLQWSLLSVAAPQQGSEQRQAAAQHHLCAASGALISWGCRCGWGQAGQAVPVVGQQGWPLELQGGRQHAVFHGKGAAVHVH